MNEKSRVQFAKERTQADDVLLEQLEDAVLHVGGGVREKREQAAAVRTRTHERREVAA